MASRVPSLSGPGRSRGALLVPRTRPGRPVDTASRQPFIASQRHPARRSRRLRRALRTTGWVLGTGLGLTVLAAVAGAGVHALTTTPLLAVRHVEVRGTRRIPEAAILAAARIEPGTNLLLLDSEAVVDRVEALPGVQRARVIRHLPGRVAVAVDERQPYALINVTGPEGGLHWVDADGHLVGPERRPTAPPLPILGGVERPSAGADYPVGDRLQTGLALLRAVQRTGGRVAAVVSEIDLSRGEGPVFYTAEGVEVRVGREGWDERLARLDGVLGELEERGERVESVDLRFRDLVVLKPRGLTARRAHKER